MHAAQIPRTGAHAGRLACRYCDPYCDTENRFQYCKTQKLELKSPKFNFFSWMTMNSLTGVATIPPLFWPNWTLALHRESRIWNTVSLGDINPILSSMLRTTVMFSLTVELHWAAKASFHFLIRYRHRPLFTPWSQSSAIIVAFEGQFCWSLPLRMTGRCCILFYIERAIGRCIDTSSAIVCLSADHIGTSSTELWALPVNVSKIVRTGGREKSCPHRPAW